MFSESLFYRIHNLEDSYTPIKTKPDKIKLFIHTFFVYPKLANFKSPPPKFVGILQLLTSMKKIGSKRKLSKKDEKLSNKMPKGKAGILKFYGECSQG